MTTVTGRVFYLDDQTVIVYADGATSAPRTTPADTYTHGLGALLRRLALATGPSGSLLIGAGSMARLGFPARSACQQAPVRPLACQCVAADAEGWVAGGSCGWWTYRRPDGRPIRVGVLPWMRDGQMPLGAPHPGDTVARLGRWSTMMGAPYYGTAGSSMTLALQQLCDPPPDDGPRDPARQRPSWRPQAGPLDGWANAEQPYRAWRPPVAPLVAGDLIGFDRIRAGLATFASLEVHPWTLRARGRIRFDPHLAGMWHITLAAWNDHRLPDPANRRDPQNLGPIPCATPTLALLQDLTDDGLFGGFEIHEAYVGPGRRLFRPWAERVRAAWDDAPNTRPGADSGESAALRETIKDGYRAAHGGMARTTSAGINRPDWYHAHDALARATVFRAINRAAAAGYWPALVDGDCAYYDTGAGTPPWRDVEDPTDPATNRLGWWRTVTRTRTGARS